MLGEDEPKSQINSHSIHRHPFLLLLLPLKCIIARRYWLTSTVRVFFSQSIHSVLWYRPGSYGAISLGSHSRPTAITTTIVESNKQPAYFITPLYSLPHFLSPSTTALRDEQLLRMKRTQRAKAQQPIHFLDHRHA